MPNERCEVGDCVPGDVLAFYGTGWKSKVIRWGTFGGPSHVALVFRYNTVPCLVESTTLSTLPCLHTGEMISGVQVQSIPDRISTYDGHVYRMPLLPHWLLSDDEDCLLTKLVLKYWVRRGYDLDRAIVSGTNLIKFLSCVPYPDPGSVFCSMLVAILLQRVGRLHISDPSTYNPRGLCSRLRRTMVHGAPQLIG